MYKIAVSIECKPEHKRWLSPYHIRSALADYLLDKGYIIAAFRVTELKKGDTVQ